ncbi:E3 UFM1-protein ligase 1-like isoform X2 [Asterias rubens]|uniref:E3 UFM1-protein ligase 1-like isoform X1 n=1 Tax=Asterias rubens TaxID=7604 RepID=UPI0014553972|nr:E3 UFM1-protein ligase 1-like isoform X1 [Asterias rubens]XP_033636033.1 E3 UFM1-protein ligase 1-like isoform X2 [Asterias rubens]
MASSEWEEVKRLAADFQRAQLTSAVQKLSERNCIEIVSKLIALKLIDVVFTLDGKEYLTPAQITKEIQDELIFHGGRLNLVDLQQILCVDFNHIEGKANELSKHDKSIQLVLGQLITRDYMDRLSEDINDQLQEAGQVTIAELTKSHDLPAFFLTEMVETRLGTIIQGQMESFDQGVIFTKAFVERHTAQIRGVFSAITKPTPVISILNQFKFPERLFYGCLQELVDSGRLNGSIAGGRQDKASYIPDLYAKTQNAWVDSFLAQNGYLEYDALTRLGISDVKQYIKRRFKSDNLLYLSSCVVGKHLQDRVEASIEEALSTGSWIDVTPLLPSSFSVDDIHQVLQQCMKGRSKLGAKVMCSTIVCSEKFLSESRAIFEQLMTQKAQQDAKNAPQLLLQVDKKAVAAISGTSESKKDRKDDRRKKAATGGGSSKGGGQGIAREVKTKKVKKNRGRDVVEEDDDISASRSHQSEELPFMSIEEIEDVLSKSLRDCPEELHSEMAADLYRPLQRAYQDIAKSIFLAAAGSVDSSKRRKNRGELEEKINGLLNNIRLFEKGIRQFLGRDEELENQLCKYLLRSLGTDITNLLLSSVTTENLMSDVDPTTLTTETRASILVKLTDDLRVPLSKLHNALNGKDLNDFFSNLEKSCDSNICDIMLKKLDKKKERQLVFNHRQALREQLQNETDPAMALHLAVVLAFQNSTQCMLHAPGKLIPPLIGFLAEHLAVDHRKLLLRYQGLVQKRLGLTREREEHSGKTLHYGNKETEEQAEVAAQLDVLLPDIKDIALSKKTATVVVES